MLLSYPDYGRVFVEVTHREHGHGGIGWEYGTCLWCPTKSRDGRDWYPLMRQLQPGHLVLHFLNDKWDGISREFRLAGVSAVARAAEVVSEQPPKPGEWANRSSYYRVCIKNYQQLPRPISLSHFLVEMEHEIRREQINEAWPAGYPFSGSELQVTMGLYIREATSLLFELFRRRINDQLKTQH